MLAAVQWLLAQVATPEGVSGVTLLAIIGHGWRMENRFRNLERKVDRMEWGHGKR